VLLLSPPRPCAAAISSSSLCCCYLLLVLVLLLTDGAPAGYLSSAIQEEGPTASALNNLAIVYQVSWKHTQARARAHTHTHTHRARTHSHRLPGQLEFRWVSRGVHYLHTDECQN